ncbi:MAG: hypothetical protein QM753_10020 [Thermomicrobiales bacterium]
MSTNTTGRWEYHLERVSEIPSEEHMNSLGDDRWELVTADMRLGILIFKRQAPTLAEQITIDQRTRVQETGR